MYVKSATLKKKQDVKVTC